jgi:fucose permease
MTRRALFIATIFLAGFLQGSDFVLIPALGATLTMPPYAFSSSAFALLFLPQTVGAILGAVAAGWVQRRLGMGRLLRLGLLTNLAAMLLLVIATRGAGPSAYGILLTEGLLLGMGFGWTLSAVNHYAAHFFGQSASASITVLNAMIGGATALSPSILSELHTHLTLSAWPIVLATGFLLASLPRLPETNDDSRASVWVRGLLPFALAVLIYAICEGSFGSWSNLYLSADKHLGSRAGIWALSAFWASMTLFRLLLAALPDRWISRRSLLVASSVGIASCFATLPWLSGMSALIWAFAMAGAACSIYYPLMMSAGLARFPEQQTQAAGLLVAALMVGEGVGSYGVGLLQRLQSLDHIFFASALWGIPLLLGAWYAGRSLTPRTAGASVHRR